MRRAFRISNFPVLLAALVMVAPTFGMLSVGTTAEAAGGPPSADIDQCANGGVGATAVICSGSAWQNGNLNANQAHYLEGDSVPYRLRFQNLLPGTHVVTIAWDTLQSGKHALDYLTTYNRTETTAVPCSGVTQVPPCGPNSTRAIPKDPAVPDGKQVDGVFTLFGGTLTGNSDYSTAGDETRITLTFTTSVPDNPVLAWGGHIATRADWGEGNSAVAIDGSPYHMRLLDLDSKGGNQDRSLSSGAVIFPATITIVKDASPNSTQAFGFTAVGLAPSPFGLVDDGDSADPPDRKVFGPITDFAAVRSVTEDVVAGWALTGIACTDPTGGTTTSGRTATFGLKEADTVTCTFSNVRNPAITVLKTADPTTIDEPGGPVLFSVAVHNESVVESVSLESLTDNLYGNVAAVGGKILDTTCSVPQTIAANGTYSCSFHANVAGDAKAAVVDVVTATAKDIRGNTLTDDDDATVTVLDVLPKLEVDKSVSPSEVAEPGGTVTFTVAVTNPSVEPLTLTTLTDDKFGALGGKGTCTLPQTIAVGGTYSCHFDESVTGNFGATHVDIITGTAKDNEGNEATDTGTATVKFLDVLPKLVVDKSVSPSKLPEPGGKVTYTVVVTNPAGAAESIKVTTLNDSKFGNLNGVGTCDVDPPVDLAPGANYTCTFEKNLGGNATDTHVNTVTATATDDEGNPATDSHDATVTFTDVLPSLEVEKTAAPTTVSEPGGDVTFQIKVTNPKTAAEPVELLTLTDDIYGDLTNKGSCLLPGALILLAPGDTYSCSFTGAVTGKPGESKKDIVTGTGKDDEGNTAKDTAEALVTITDVLPTVAVVKEANPTTVPEPGGDVTFTVRVRNPGTAVEPIVVSKLVDSVYENLDGLGTCDVTPAVTLAIGAEYSCFFTKKVTGEAGSIHKNVVTATANDDENNPATASDDATVTVTDVLPTIAVDKAAAPEEIPEPGGDVTYTVTVTNTSVEPVILQTLSDNPAGNLVGKGTCLPGGTPVTIAIGGTYSCSFTAPVQGDAKSTHLDTVTAGAVDNEGNPATGTDQATVTVTDVKPVILVDKGAAPSEVAEPGGDVTFTVVVTNPASAVEAVAVTSLLDSVYGNLDKQGSCDLSKATAIAPGGQYTCTFTKAVSGNAGKVHTNVVTALAKDNEGNITPPVTDDAKVTVVDVAPKVAVDKLASPSELPEPGGTVTFTVTVTNPGTAESLTLSSLTDDVYGNIAVKGDKVIDTTCSVPQTIAPRTATDGQYTCMFKGAVGGDAGTQHPDTVTAVAKDDDGNEISDIAKALVTITDVIPTVLVTKSAEPTTLAEPGGNATFRVTVTNPATAVEPITITSLVDSVFKNLDGKGTCDLSPAVVLQPGDQYPCTFTGPVSGNAGFVHVNEVTGTATDNEKNSVSDADKAEVTITDVLPVIDLIKTAGASTVHSGDSVTYTYTATTSGREPLTDVEVTDDRCNPVNYVSGDTNNDKALTVGEVWTFTCTTKITGTTTNTATGTGKDDEGNTATDTDTATVGVVDPKVVIDKVAALTQISVGDSVTYTYTVTNPGNAPLANVTVTDDKCGPVTLTGGDTDNDALLDPGEAWKFTCTATLSSPGQITNTGTVKGKDPIGLEVTATDTAVVSVLEIEVLPAVLNPPAPLLPAPALQQTLPRTGADLLRWTASGLALIAGGLLLRRRRES